MDERRAAVVTEARRWVGTPYRHQAAVLGAGCDCVGLIRGVGFATGMLPRRDAEWKRFNAYGRLPNPARMTEGMRTFLIESEAGPLPGDILWLSWRANLPMHLAIYTGQNIIHSFSDVGRVVEHGLTGEWVERVHSVWRYPGLAE
jgi:NlpC/P60 family putative phage cell wall peptidase